MILEILFFTLILLLPLQFGRHFWPKASFLFGLKIDFLSPTIYLQDIIIVLLLIYYLPKIIPQILKDKKYLILCLLYLLFAFLNIYISLTPLSSFFSWLRITEMILLGLMVIKNLNLSLRLLEKLLPFSLIFELVLSLVQVVKQSSLNGLFWFLGERSFNVLTPGIARASFLEKVFLRPYGTFSHPNSLAGFALVALILVFTKGQLKISDKVAVLAGILLIFLSFSRTVWLTAFILGLGYFLWQFRKNWRKRTFNLSFLYLTTLLFLPVSLFLFSRTVVDPSSFFIRQDLAYFAFFLIKSHFLLGVGAGQFVVALSQSKVIWSSLYWLQPVHNIFLLMTAETGILGLGLFLGILLLAVKKLVCSPVFNLKFRLLVSLLAILLTGLFDHYSLTLIQNQLIFVLVLSLSLAS